MALSWPRPSPQTARDPFAVCLEPGSQARAPSGLADDLGELSGLLGPNGAGKPPRSRWALRVITSRLTPERLGIAGISGGRASGGDGPCCPAPRLARLERAHTSPRPGCSSRCGCAGTRAGVADRGAEHGYGLAEGADEGGEGVGAGGFTQVVLGGGGDLGLGAVEVEVVQDGVDVDEQEHDVAGVPGVEGELGELVVAAGLADQAHGVLAGAWWRAWVVRSR